MINFRHYKHFHLCCGSGSGAAGFNDATARLGNEMRGGRCIGGIDVDPAGLHDFKMMTGVDGMLMDLFDEEQYRAFHGCAPPPGWKEATPGDIMRAQSFETPDIAFTSAPCKGNSGLLAEQAAKTDKYVALNALALRSMFLLFEANKNNPVKIVLFENVPRIATRSRHLLDQIIGMARAYDYAAQETVHDCGEMGNLGQSRKRYLLVMRHVPQVPNFLYEPVKYPLRGVGEILDRLPMPLSGLGGPLHRMPALHWKTWVRLAFVEAGSDWRSLNKLAVDGGVLRDFAIAPDYGIRGVLGVTRWEDTAATIKGRSLPTNGEHAVADPRPPQPWAASVLGVNNWDDTGATVTGRMAPGGGAHAVADPRTGFGQSTHHHVLKVTPWDRPGGTVTSSHGPTSGAMSVADPRVDGHPKSVQLGVRPWDQPTGVITGKMIAGGGPNAVADPRLDGVRFNSAFRIVRYAEASPAVAGPGGPAGGLAVADPRPLPRSDYKQNKYKVTPFGAPAGTVIAASTTGNGAFAVADPRYTEWHPGASSSKLRITEWDEAARSITGSQQVASGAGAVADPRPEFARDGRDKYLTAGHYGVVAYSATSRAITGAGQHDNGPWSVADPRLQTFATIEGEPPALPGPNDKLVCVIRALDGTWHRPFTTLECAALQSMFDPEKYFTSPEDYWDLHGMSDSAKRERIGNAVPRASAKGMAEAIYRCLLAAESGETFTLSSEPIWVQPVVLALGAAR